MRPWNLLSLMVIGFASTGCATSQGVRYVYQDGNFGVVGMPENTDRWPHHYRHKAEKLMAEHFPDGHEIVRAEEVVEGERTSKVEGSRTAEVSPQGTATVLSVAKFGHTSSRSTADTTKIKECRIIYRRIGSPEVPSGFSSVADPTPTQYIDPNAIERNKIATGGAARPQAAAPDQPKDKDKEKPAEARPTPQDGSWGA